MMRDQSPWLMTDERLGRRLFEAIRRVPPGGGVILRHDRLHPERRAVLARDVADACRARGLALGVAGDAALAKAVRADLVHRPLADTDLPVSLPVHDEGEARTARERGAAMVFVSPVFATQSHPEGEPLGIERAARLAAMSGCPAIALGGMDEKLFGTLPDVFAGWAGIGAFLR